MEGEMHGTYWSHDVEHKLTRDMREVCSMFAVKHMKIILINIHSVEFKTTRKRNWTNIFMVSQYILHCVLFEQNTNKKQVNQCQKQMKQIYEENKTVWQTICILFHHVSLPSQARRVGKKNR